MVVARAFLAVAAVAAVLQLAAAADHPVGGSGSWDASGTSYNAWSAKQTFKQGDTLCKITDDDLDYSDILSSVPLLCLPSHHKSEKN